MIDRLKDYLWTFIVTVSVLFGAWVSWSVQKGRVERAETAAAAFKAEAKGLRTQLEAERASARVREQHRAAVAAQKEKNRAQLKTALDASPAWRDEPVPAAVADSLRDAARRARAPAE